MPKKIKKVFDEFQLELIDMGYSQELRWTYGKVCSTEFFLVIR